ncbi:MAG: hypothetical protein IJY74_01175, partial [Oscillospiraceae bacterium]|nr:hypothetical protein [Oscillospiraceae bacterium]
VNSDVVVSLLDVVMLNKGLAGAVSLNEQQMKNAECCADGSLSSLDVTALLGYIVEQIDTLPVSP